MEPQCFIVIMVRPDTRAGYSNIKMNLETMKLSLFKHVIPKANIHISYLMDEISIAGETYSDIVRKHLTLLHLIITNIQVLNVYQEWLMGGRQGHVPE